MTGPASRGVRVLAVTAAAVAAFVVFSSAVAARGVVLAREDALGRVALGGEP